MVFGPKMAIFPTFFFLGNIGWKNVVNDILERKKIFYAQKTRRMKSRQLDINIFPKGLTHGFGPKMAIFATFFLGNIGLEMSFTIFQNEKAPFYATKTRRSKIQKIDIFPKVITRGFGPKMVIFKCFFFQAIQARKMSFTIFQNKKRPSRLQKQEVQKFEKLSFFFKAVNPWFWSKNGNFSNFFFSYTIQAAKMSFTISQNEKSFSTLKKQEV